MTSMIRTAADILAEVDAANGQQSPLAVNPNARPAVLRWEDPPPRDARGGSRFQAPESKYASLADELRSRPGVWAIVFVGTKPQATSVARVIYLGQVPVFGFRDFEAVTRAVAGQTRVYARYVGEQG